MTTQSTELNPVLSEKPPATLGDQLQAKRIEALTITATVAEQIEPYKITMEGMTADTEPEAAQVGDFMNRIKQQRAILEDKRHIAVDEFSAWVKDINSIFKESRDLCDEATNIGKKLLDDYQLRKFQEEERIRKEEEAKRQEKERQALEVAKKIEEAGQKETAEKIIEQEIKKTEKVQAPSKVAPTRGLESTVSARKTWAAEVVDVKLLCKAISEGMMPADCIAVLPAKLNELARALKQEKTMGGVRYYQKISSAVR